MDNPNKRVCGECGHVYDIQISLYCSPCMQQTRKAQEDREFAAKMSPAGLAGFLGR